MPEIALTAQFLDRFAAPLRRPSRDLAFGRHRPRRERLHAGIAAGDVKVVAGARSALFLPYAQSRPDRRRRGARGRLQAGGRGPLPRPRHGGGARPDRGRAGRSSPRRRPRSRAASTRSAGATATSRCPSGSAGASCRRSAPSISSARTMPERPLALADPDRGGHRETVERGEQALLFLNRRGYAPLTLCRACAHRYECPNCSAWLVEHRFRRALVCHHCGHVERTPAGLRRLRQPRFARVLRARRRAHRRGGGRAVSRAGARSSCRAIFQAAPSACARNSPPSRRASSTSSSARSSWPRGTISRC